MPEISGYFVQKLPVKLCVNMGGFSQPKFLVRGAGYNKLSFTRFLTTPSLALHTTIRTFLTDIVMCFYTFYTGFNKKITNQI